MTDAVRASTVVEAAPETVFAVLADPSAHAAIDGTGWVRDALDGERLTAVGQLFRMAMHHDNHPDGDYQMTNRVRVVDPPRAIAWEPGQDVTGDGTVSYGGWIWRYDLDPVGPAETRVTLTYDWSAVPPPLREYIHFPPFPSGHLDNSLANLAALALSRAASRP